MRGTAHGNDFRVDLDQAARTTIDPFRLMKANNPLSALHRTTKYPIERSALQKTRVPRAIARIDQKHIPMPGRTHAFAKQGLTRNQRLHRHDAGGELLQVHMCRHAP